MTKKDQFGRTLIEGRKIGCSMSKKMPTFNFSTIEDYLLTDEEKEQLHADLAEIARTRRLAEDAAAQLPMG